LPEGTVHTLRDLVVHCESGEEPGTYTTVEKGAIKFQYNATDESGYFAAYTWANNGMRFRYDMFYDDEEQDNVSTAVVLINHFEKSYWMGAGGQWMDLSEQYNPAYINTPFAVDETEMKPYLQSNTMNIAGKKCNVYKVTYEGIVFVYGVWNGLILYMEKDGEAMMTAVAATLDVPEVAFTQTFNVTWL